MNTRVRKLYGASTSDANDTAHLDIQRTGFLTGVFFDFQMVGSTAGARAIWEVSFQSTAQLTTNDTMGAIASSSIIYQFSTNGGANCARSVLVAGLYIPVKQGDRIYLHTEINGTISLNQCNAYLYLTT